MAAVQVQVSQADRSAMRPADDELAVGWWPIQPLRVRAFTRPFTMSYSVWEMRGVMAASSSAKTLKVKLQKPSPVTTAQANPIVPEMASEPWAATVTTGTSSRRGR